MGRFPFSRPSVGRGPLASLNAESGFTLIETLIATIVLVVGLVAVAQLLATSVVMNTDAQVATAAALHAQAKLDALMKTSFTAPSVQISAADTLASNVANYFDTPAAGVTRRWQVTAGPSDTRTVTVRVLSPRARLYGTTVEMTTRIRQW